MNRTEQIDNFLNKWNEMLKAANEIDGFKWNFEVTITSDDSIKEDRVNTIKEINESFSKNNMKWTSSES